jgi:hypothetical protein
MREECPQGLKPDRLGREMSELKLRPPAYSAIQRFSAKPHD